MKPSRPKNKDYNRMIEQVALSPARYHTTLSADSAPHITAAVIQDLSLPLGEMISVSVTDSAIQRSFRMDCRSPQKMSQSCWSRIKRFSGNPFQLVSILDSNFASNLRFKNFLGHRQPHRKESPALVGCHRDGTIVFFNDLTNQR